MHLPPRASHMWRSLRGVGGSCSPLSILLFSRSFPTPCTSSSPPPPFWSLPCLFPPYLLPPPRPPPPPSCSCSSSCSSCSSCSSSYVLAAAALELQRQTSKQRASTNKKQQKNPYGPLLTCDKSNKNTYTIRILWGNPFTENSLRSTSVMQRYHIMASKCHKYQ
jgi:hypothetical protein